jgi:mono/diheme cytochrome c family protein
MNVVSRIFGFVLSMSLAAAVLFSAATSSAQRPSEGQQLVEKRCQGCHTMRRVETSAKDAKGWQETIQVMIQDGAEVEESEIPLMVQWLTREHGPVPEGAGKQILLNTCTMCHNLQRIKNGRRSPEEWEETLSAMLNEGAPVSDEQLPVIHTYLSRHFGVN